MVYKKDTGIFGSRSPKTKHLEAVRVLDIILDINHPFAEKYGGYDSIGTITYTKLKDNTPLEAPWDNQKVAIPFFSFIKKYPIIAEKIISSGTLRYEDKPWNDLYNKFDKNYYLL